MGRCEQEGLASLPNKVSPFPGVSLGSDPSAQLAALRDRRPPAPHVARAAPGSALVAQKSVVARAPASCAARTQWNSERPLPRGVGFLREDRGHGCSCRSEFPGVEAAGTV